MVQIVVAGSSADNKRKTIHFALLAACQRGQTCGFSLYQPVSNVMRAMVPASARSCMVSSLGNHSARHQSFLSSISIFRPSSNISPVHIWRSSHITQKSPRCQVISALASSAATLPDKDQASRTAVFVQPEHSDSDEDMSGHGWDEQELARQQVDQESQVTLEWPAICRQVRVVLKLVRVLWCTCSHQLCLPHSAIHAWDR